MNLSIKQLLTGTPIRMRYVRRYSTSRVVYPESVAEHSYYVCLYALAVADWVAQNENMDANLRNTLVAMTLSRAVLHDIEEARSGDIHRPFKHSTLRLKETLGEAACVAAKQILREVFPEDKRTQDDYYFTWGSAKDVSKAGRIVAFADYLSVLAFVNAEGADVLRSLCLDTLPKHSDGFKEPAYEFIRPLVDQARDLYLEVFSTIGVTP